MELVKVLFPPSNPWLNSVELKRRSFAECLDYHFPYT